jgi:hypothetical protein
MNPFTPDFSAIDKSRRHEKHLFLIAVALVVSVLLTIALVGPLIAKDSTRILNAMCDVETVV